MMLYVFFSGYVDHNEVMDHMLYVFFSGYVDHNEVMDHFLFSTHQNSADQIPSSPRSRSCPPEAGSRSPTPVITESNADTAEPSTCQQQSSGKRKGALTEKDLCYKRLRIRQEETHNIKKNLMEETSKAVIDACKRFASSSERIANAVVELCEKIGKSYEESSQSSKEKTADETR